MDLYSLPVTASVGDKFYKDTTNRPAVQVTIIRIGEMSVGYLYRYENEPNWFVYGYAIRWKGCWPNGDLRDLLGEDPDVGEMAERLLNYEGYLNNRQDVLDAAIARWRAREEVS